MARAVLFLGRSDNSNDNAVFIFHSVGSGLVSLVKPNSSTYQRFIFIVAPCAANQWTCFNRKCVSENATCNAKQECDDGSDETYTHARCGGNAKYPPRPSLSKALLPVSLIWEYNKNILSPNSSCRFSNLNNVPILITGSGLGVLILKMQTSSTFPKQV